MGFFKSVGKFLSSAAKFVVKVVKLVVINAIKILVKSIASTIAVASKVLKGDFKGAWQEIKDYTDYVWKEFIVPIVEFIFVDLLGFKGEDIIHVKVFTSPMNPDYKRQKSFAAIKSILTGTDIVDEILLEQKRVIQQADNKITMKKVYPVLVETSLRYTDKEALSREFFQGRTVLISQAGTASATVDAWLTLQNVYEGKYKDYTIVYNGVLQYVLTIVQLTKETIKVNFVSNDAAQTLGYVVVPDTIDYQTTFGVVQSADGVGEEVFALRPSEYLKTSYAAIADNNLSMAVYPIRRNFKFNDNVAQQEVMNSEGYSFKDIKKSLESNPDIDGVSDAYIVHGIDLYSKRPAHNHLTFEWMSELYNVHDSDNSHTDTEFKGTISMVAGTDIKQQPLGV